MVKLAHAVCEVWSGVRAEQQKAVPCGDPSPHDLTTGPSRERVGVIRYTGVGSSQRAQSQVIESVGITAAYSVPAVLSEV